MGIVMNWLGQAAAGIGPIFYRLVFLSITAGGIGVVLLLVRRVADHKISPGWKYALWGVVLLALVVPWRPQSGLALIQDRGAVEDISYRKQQKVVRERIRVLETENLAMADEKAVARLRTQEKRVSLGVAVFDVAIPLIWFLGMLGGGVSYGIGKMVLWNRIKKHQIPAREYDSLLAVCKEKMNIQADIGVVVQDYISTPALMGGIHALVLLPKYAETMEEENLTYILLHELAHFKRKDMWLNEMLLILQVVYWFNPLIWLLFWRIREDMEVMNDAYVLKCIGYEKHKNYAYSMVEVLGRSRQISLVPKLLCMADGRQNIERRIRMIQSSSVFQQRKVKIGVSCFCLGLLAVISVVFLTQGNSSRETMKWANRLDIADVARIELVATPQGTTGYQLIDQEDYKDVVALINQSKGRYIANPDSLAGGSVMFYVTEKDHTIHKVINMANTYLVIDGDSYKASYQWLSNWKYDRGNAPLPDPFHYGDPSLAQKSLEEDTIPVSADKRVLTQQEIEEVNRAFEALLPSDQPEYEFSLNPICHFLNSYYERPEDMNLEQFIWYFKGEELDADQKEDRKQLVLIKELKNSPFKQAASIEDMLPIQRKSLQSVEDCLKQYMGIGVKDLNNTEHVLYLDQPYDSFYTYTSDAGFGVFSCNSGEIEGDIVRLFSETATLILQNRDGKYYIISHLEGGKSANMTVE